MEYDGGDRNGGMVQSCWDYFFFFVLEFRTTVETSPSLYLILYLIPSSTSPFRILVYRLSSQH